MNNDTHSVWISTSAALFFPISVFLVHPSNIIFRNYRDLPIVPDTWQLFGIAFLLVSALSLIVIWLSSRFKIFDTVNRLLALTGIQVLFLGTASRALNPLDNLLLYALLESAVFLVLGYFLLGMQQHNIRKLFAALTPLILTLHLVGVHPYAMAALEEIQQSQSFAQDSPSNRPEKAPPALNIYHIVLDGFQKQAYDELLRENSKRTLRDFTYFKNFTSQYERTHFSLANLFLGKRIGLADIPHTQWEDPAFLKNSYVKALYENGMSIHFYPHYGYHRPDVEARFSPTIGSFITNSSKVFDNSAKDELITTNNYTPTTVDLWFNNLLPNSLLKYLQRKNPVNLHEWKVGFSITDQLYAWGILPESLRAHQAFTYRGRQVKYSDIPVLSKVNFNRLTRDEATRSSTGNYVFAHLLIPHGPYTLDENGNFPDQPLPLIDGYKAMAKLGLLMIQNLISELKASGRYESSLIVVHSDHGYYWPTQLFDAPDATNADNRASPQQIQLGKFDQRLAENIHIMSSALLLVKFPYQSDTRVSTAVVQTPDITATLLKYANNAFYRNEGLALDSDTRQARDGKAYFYVGSQEKKPDSFAEYIQQAGQWRFARTINVSK